MPDEASHSSLWMVQRHAWAILFLIIGISTLVASGLGGFSQIPGDLGDARFNMYILEHFLKFITGQASSFWDAPIFYPYPLATAFTANHLGTAPVYGIFRFVGFDRETAFQLWYVAAFLTSFLSAYYVLVRARFQTAAAALGAFIFAFGLPVLAQQNHVQLLWRAGIPLSLWWMWRFIQLGRPRMLFLSALAAVWQLYADIYLGVLLAMLLLASLVAHGFVLPGGVRTVRLYWQGIATTLASRRSLLWVTGIVLLAVAAISLMLPYVEVARRYGFERELGEVRLMLPQWRSYLLSDQSLLWKGISAQIQGLQMRWEHQLFIGIGPAILVALAFFQRPPAPSHRFTRAARIALVVLGVVTIHLQNFSLYEFALAIPGLSAMRAVSRIIEIMMWPVAVLAAAAAMRLLSQPKPWLQILVPALALITLFESATSLQFRVSKDEAQKRIIALKQAIASAPPPRSRLPILFVASKPGEAPLLVELDAMLTSQDLGWATLNGYSGNTPPIYEPSATCSNAALRLRSFSQSEFARLETDVDALVDRVMPIGFVDCPSR